MNTERKKLRLKDYDYSQEGYYFITILIKDRECIFGKILNEKLILNEYGVIAEKYWKEIPDHYIYIDIDEFIIMPNHIHGIIVINYEHQSSVMVGHCPTITIKKTKKSNEKYGKLSRIINAYKNMVTKSIKGIKPEINFKWHRSFYDHIIREEKDLNNIRHYIKYNHLKWNEDEYYLNGE